MQSPAFRMLAPAALRPPPYMSRAGVDVASMRSSPDRARALPLSISGMAAGLRLRRVVDVDVDDWHGDDVDVCELVNCVLLLGAAVRVKDCVSAAWTATVAMNVISFIIVVLIMMRCFL